MGDPISIRPAFTRIEYAKRRREKLLAFEREYGPFPVDEILHSHLEDFDELHTLGRADAPQPHKIPKPAYFQRQTVLRPDQQRDHPICSR